MQKIMGTNKAKCSYDDLIMWVASTWRDNKDCSVINENNFLEIPHTQYGKKGNQEHTEVKSNMGRHLFKKLSK